MIREKEQERVVRVMADYISREPMIREMQQLYEGVPYNFPNSTHTEWEILRGKYAAFIDYLKQQPAADVQPTEKVEEYRSLLEECEKKLSYLFECEIESTWESQKVKELIAKIQSCIQNNYGGG